MSAEGANALGAQASLPAMSTEGATKGLTADFTDHAD
jgi:hypothetical protein